MHGQENINNVRFPRIRSSCVKVRTVYKLRIDRPEKKVILIIRQSIAQYSNITLKQTLNLAVY